MPEAFSFSAAVLLSALGPAEADDGGADVEGAAFGGGDPALFELNEAFDEDEEGGRVEWLEKSV